MSSKIKKPTASVSSITFSDGTIIKLDPNEKLMLVGPNNSGKSLTLREVVNSVSSQHGDFERNLVVKNLSLNKSGDVVSLRKYLKAKGTFLHQNYHVGNWQVHEPTIATWEQSRFLWQLAPGFIKNISADTRLSITAIQNNVSTYEQKTAPQHVLYDDNELMKRVSDLFHQAFGNDIFFDYRGGGSLPIHVGKRPKRKPTEDSHDNSYVNRIRKFPLLNEQGDGVKSYTGILFEAVAVERDITLIDEPEAFLHPPQMRQLGETLGNEVKGQLLVATHSSDILKGFLNAKPDFVRVVRIQRKGKVNDVKEASLETIKTFWEQPELKYSNALDGIFHEQTIICEGHSDCLLYNATADHMEHNTNKSWRDTVFVSAGGKQNIHGIASVLREIGVPVTGVYDFDFLSNRNLVKLAVEGFGGDWEIIKPLWSKVSDAVIEAAKPLTSDEIKKEVIDLLNTPKNESVSIRRITKTLKSGNPWTNAKSCGLKAIPNEQSQKDFAYLDTELKALGIVVVPVGALENFYPDIKLDGPKFVTKLLQEISLDDKRLSHLRNFVKTVHDLQMRR